MKKIKTLFKRDFTVSGNPITTEYNTGTEWVLNNEGVATRKYDGTCVLVRSGKLYKRHELRAGKEAPTGFELADTDQETGKSMGWLEVGHGSEDKWHREAVGGNPDGVDLPDGTYELIGPKVQGNPENSERHILVAHENAEEYSDVPTDFDELKNWLESKDIEGIVWHHPDGRMVKIKKRDFRLRRVV